MDFKKSKYIDAGVFIWPVIFYGLRPGGFSHRIKAIDNQLL